jgi:hypothetical protein
MNASTKSMNAEAETIEATVVYANLFNKGLNRVVEVSKTSLDLAVEQNTEVLDCCKKALKASIMPGLSLFDLAGQAFESYVALQKNLLDLAVEQSTAVTEAAQEYSYDVGEAGAITNRLIGHSVDRMMAGQKSVLVAVPRGKSRR